MCHDERTSYSSNLGARRIYSDNIKDRFYVLFARGVAGWRVRGLLSWLGSGVRGPTSGFPRGIGRETRRLYRRIRRSDGWIDDMNGLRVFEWVCGHEHICGSIRRRWSRSGVRGIGAKSPKSLSLASVSVILSGVLAG